MHRGFACAEQRQFVPVLRQPPLPQQPTRIVRAGAITVQTPQTVSAPKPVATLEFPATVEFRATVHNMREKEQLYLVGGVEELGSWEAADAKQMLSTDGKTWSIKVELKPHTTISYKYIRIFSGDDKSWVQWEKGPNSRDREFRWDGKTTIQDDEEVSSFLETRELQIISHNSESQEIVLAGRGEHSVSVSTDFFGLSKQDVPKSTWVREMFDKMQSEIHYLAGKLERELSELSHRQDGIEKSVKYLSRISIELESKISDAEEKIEETAKTAIVQQEETTLTKCSLFEENINMEIDCLQRRMQKTKDDSDKRLENLEKVIDSQKCNVDSHSKSLVRLQRQINDLELKIPDDSAAPTALPSHAPRVDLQSPKVQPTFEQNEGLDEWNEVASKSDASKVMGMDAEAPSKTSPASGKPDASKVTGMDAEAPSKTSPASDKPDASKVTGMDAEAPSKTSPASGKSDDLKAPKQSHPEIKSAFCGFQHPPKPEDVDMARICSEVEEELCEARRRDLPVDARKSLLRKSLLRLHPDKGKPSAGAIWIEDWKNTHIKWYYHPHPVPKDQQKYLTESGSTKDP